MSDRDPYQGFGFPRIHLRQGDHELIVPIYRDMTTAEGIAQIADFLDVKLLRAAGKVLPSRTWWIEDD